jgi:hypothetical protein
VAFVKLTEPDGGAVYIQDSCITRVMENDDYRGYAKEARSVVEFLGGKQAVMETVDEIIQKIGG